MTDAIVPGSGDDEIVLCAQGRTDLDEGGSETLFQLGGGIRSTRPIDTRKRSNTVTQHVLFIVTNAAIIGPHNRKTGFFFAEVAHPFEVL